jgi:hypothetical protein
LRMETVRRTSLTPWMSSDFPAAGQCSSVTNRQRDDAA